MTKSTEVDRAYKRCLSLSAIIRHVRDDALARPTAATWLALGLVEQGDTKPEASERMERLFDELQALVEHLFILDMTARFERASLARVGNYVGSARSALARSMGKAGLPALSAGVVRDAAEFRGMTAYLDLLDGHVDGG